MSPFFAIVFSHFMTDLYVRQRSIYLTYLSKPLGLNGLLELGAITTGAVMAAGLSQPIFGWLAIGLGPTRMILAAIAWIALTYALSVVLPIAAAALLILASSGNGMYHPAGVSQATLIGRTQLAGRGSLCCIVLFLFGQLGFFAGPLCRWSPAFQMG